MSRWPHAKRLRRAFRRSLSAPRDMSRPAVLMHQTHGCSHKTQAFSPKFLSNSRKQRFLAGSSRHAHMPTPQPASSPPRLPCRSPGPGPSVASPSCPKPHLSRVSKLTPARDATERARDCPGGPMPSDCAGHFGGHYRRHAICPVPQSSCTRGIGSG